MEQDKQSYQLMQQALQFAKIYHLCCRWASSKHMNLVNLLILVELFCRPEEREAGRLADRLYLPRQTVTYAVDSLAQKGYVARMPHPKDKRRKLLVLTQEGRRFIQATIEEFTQEFFLFTDQFISDREQLFRELEGLLDRFEDQLAQSPDPEEGGCQP